MTKFQSGLFRTICKKRGFMMVQLTLVGEVATVLPDSNPARSVTCSKIRHNFLSNKHAEILIFLTRAWTRMTLKLSSA